MNVALLMKVGWNLVTLLTGLRSQVMLIKYGLDHANLPHVLPTRYSSHLWKSIGKVCNDSMMGILWYIGNGRKVRFWWDGWVTKTQPLIFYAVASVPNNIINKIAAEFVDGNGNWQWGSFDSLPPNNILLRIASFQPPMFERDEDQVYWAR